MQEFKLLISSIDTRETRTILLLDCVFQIAWKRLFSKTQIRHYASRSIFMLLENERKLVEVLLHVFRFEDCKLTF